jgi:hypothetical protein
MLGPNMWSQIWDSARNLFRTWRFCPNMTRIDELHFAGKAQRCMLVRQPFWQVRETGSLLLQTFCTAVPELPEFCRQFLAVVLDSSTERIAIIINATNRVKEKNNARANAVTSTAQAARPIHTPQSDSAQNSTNSSEIFAKHNSPRLEARRVFCYYVLSVLDHDDMLMAKITFSDGTTSHPSGSVYRNNVKGSDSNTPRSLTDGTR